MNIFLNFAISFFKEIISPQALLYIVILGMLFWIKFNCLATITKRITDIIKWQDKHEKRSNEIFKTINKHGEDIASLKAGKVDK